jgi:hypothetical protein
MRPDARHARPTASVVAAPLSARWAGANVG